MGLMVVYFDFFGTRFFGLGPDTALVRSAKINEEGADCGHGIRSPQFIEHDLLATVARFRRGACIGGKALWRFVIRAARRARRSNSFLAPSFGDLFHASDIGHAVYCTGTVAAMRGVRRPKKPQIIPEFLRC